MTREPREPNPTTYAGRFAVRLRKLRQKAGLTQGELAKRLGSYQRTISGWETGQGAPSYTKLPQIAEALGVKPRDLLPEE